MKLGTSTIKRIGIGAVAVLGGYLGHLSLTRAPDRPTGALGYYAQVMADEPVAYWRLAEASGSTFSDETANSYDATKVNTPTLGVAGATIGNTAITVGSANLAERASVVTDGRLPATYEVWVKTTSEADGNVLIAGKSDNSKAAGISLSGAGLAVVYSNGNGGTYYSVTGTTAINDGAWHHIVGVVTTAGLEVFVDGVSEGTLVQAIASASDYDRLTLGAFTGGSGAYVGSIDEPAIYHSALSEERILAHYVAAPYTEIAPTYNADPVIVTNMLGRPTVYTGTTWTTAATSGYRWRVNGIHDPSQDDELIYGGTLSGGDELVLQAWGENVTGEVVVDSNALTWAVPDLIEPYDAGEYSIAATADSFPAYTANSAGTIIDLDDYGAIPNDNLDDTAALRAAYEACRVAHLAAPATMVTLLVSTPGNYVVIPDSGTDYILSNPFSNFTMETVDGPEDVTFIQLAPRGLDPNLAMYQRGGFWTTLGDGAAIENIKFRGFRLCGMAEITSDAGATDPNLPGWDVSHKGFAIFNRSVTGVHLEHMEVTHHRGEQYYAGGSAELGAFYTQYSVFRRSNASMISMGGDIYMDYVHVYDGYNGTESFARSAAQGSTITNCTIEVNRNLTGELYVGTFGIVYLGFPDSQLTVTDCKIGNTINGGVFLSEGGSNVLIDNVDFTDTKVFTAVFGNYYPEDFDDLNIWNDWTISNCTFTTDARNIDFAITADLPASTRTNWTIDGNTVVSSGGFSYGNLVSFNYPPTSGFTFSNNTVANAIPIAANTGLRAEWTSNTVTGTYANGTTFTDNCEREVDEPWSIYPAWPNVNVVFSCGEIPTRILEIDPTKLADYPTGFPIRIVRTGENPAIRGIEVKPDASWNTLTAGYMIFEGAVLNLVKNASGKFDFVSYTPPTVNLRTWDEFTGIKTSATDIALMGQDSVTLAPSVAHTYTTFSGVAIGKTVTLNLNGNVTLDHQAGVIEMSTGVDYVSSGTVALSATRAADGTLEVTIP